MEVNAECTLLVDGDGQHPAEYAAEMCRLVLDDGYDMVSGDRLSTSYYTKNKRRFHNFGNMLVQFMVNWLFHGDIKDCMSGYRAFSYPFVKSFPVLSRGFEIETEMSIHGVEKHMATTSIPVSFKNRPEGSISTMNTIRDGFRVIFTILRLHKNYRPLQFFSALSLLLVIAAAAIFMPALKALLNGTDVPVPTLVVSGFAALAAIQCFFSGLILSTINQKNLQDFELRLIDSNTHLSNTHLSSCIQRRNENDNF
jgi:hypothetical protein